MLISIIIPLYNASAFLDQTILSVVKQTYTNWELIIVDDGSTDNSAQIAKDYLSDTRITYLYKQNTGVSDTRNFGAKIAKGDYLCFLDADDLFFEENLSRKARLLDQHPQYGLVFSDVEIIDADGKPTGKYFTGKGGWLIDEILLWDGFNVPGPSSVLIRKDVFVEVGQWDTSFSTAADQDLFFRVAAKYQLGYISTTLTAYRVLPGSMSRDLTLMQRDHIGVFKKAQANNLFKSYWFRRQCFSNLYFILAGSWWVNGNNKKKGVFFIIKAILTYPPSIKKLFRKMKV